jgi:hypothetical protein
MEEIKYAINYIGFKTKEELKNHIESILYKKIINLEDKQFLISFIYEFNFVSNFTESIKNVEIGTSSKNNNVKCIKVISGDNKIFEINHYKAIQQLIPIKSYSDLNPLNFKISFGKYKDKTIEWIYYNDNQYFNWLCKQDFKSSKIKEKLKEFIKSIKTEFDKNYTIEDLTEAVKTENYELAAIIKKHLDN